MKLLERYMDAVRPLLPRKTQSDILRELSDDILSQMEERADEIGRPLNETEQAEVIKRHGHPVIVAARYAKVRYLIGPEVFPFYWLILRISAAGALLVRTVIAVVIIMLSADPRREIVPALVAVPFVLVPVFCWITGAFAAFEICQSALRLKLRFNWDPRSLPEIGKNTIAVPRTHSVAEIIFGVAALLWWQALPAAPYLALGPAATILTFGPIWTTLYWPVFLLTAAGVGKGIVNLLRPEMTPLRTRVHFLISAAGLATMCAALRAGNWVAVAPWVHDPGRYERLVTVVNQVLFFCLVAGLLIGAGQLIWQIVRHVRDSFLQHGMQATQAVHRS